MDKLDEAIKQIKEIECPTGELEQRVAVILSDYNLTNENINSVIRDEKMDIPGAEAFYAETTNGKLVVIATSGMDDYVAKVTNAYFR